MVEERISLFDFGLDSNGNYENLKELVQKEMLEKWKDYSYEELVADYESNNDYCVVATFYRNSMSQYGKELEDLRKDIKTIAQTKCYHYATFKNNLFAYSYKVDKNYYWFAIENEKHIVIIRQTDNIDKILCGEESICYPACDCYLFEKAENGITEIKSGYGERENDIRYKVLCGELKICEFSKNRLYADKKPKDFYECEFSLRDFINYWGESDK